MADQYGVVISQKGKVKLFYSGRDICNRNDVCVKSEDMRDTFTESRGHRDGVSVGAIFVNYELNLSR
jgi:hypothetical protein